MEDSHIVDLYWKRDEAAIARTADKYGNYLHAIAYGVLANAPDADECVNDTYLDAWNAMPPHRPSVLSVFLGKITRRVSIDRWRKRTAGKRGGAEIDRVLDELEDCVSGDGGVEEEVERRELIGRINAFLRGLPADERRVFLCRYWYLEPVSAVAERFGFTESKVAAMLRRTRVKLRTLLAKEGY